MYFIRAELRTAYELGERLLQRAQEAHRPEAIYLAINLAAQLAHHFRRSDNVSKAVEYLGRAGQQALQRSAHADAIGSLTAAIELLQKPIWTLGYPDRALERQTQLRE
jgi:predicted ATPase